MNALYGLLLEVELLDQIILNDRYIFLSLERLYWIYIPKSKITVAALTSLVTLGIASFPVSLLPIFGMKIQTLLLNMCFFAYEQYLKPFLYAYCILYVFSDCALCSFYHLGYYRHFLDDKSKWKTCCSPLNFILPICILN